jgi:hypothetical protein
VRGEIFEGVADTVVALRRLFFSAISEGDVDDDHLFIKPRCVALVVGLHRNMKSDSSLI